MQLTEKLYWYPWQGMANNCNTCLFKGEQTILFDPGHIRNEFNENCLEMIARQMAADGFDFTSVDLILCTHGHPDHVESVGLIREKSGARFGIHQDDEFIIEALTGHYASQTGQELPSLKPDFYLEEGDLDLGSEKGKNDLIKAVHTPGHSPGGTCFYLPAEKALITGDTVFDGSIGRTDLPGGKMETLAQGIDKLSRLEEVELLLPGHMGHISGSAAIKSNFDQIKRFFFG